MSTGTTLTPSDAAAWFAALISLISLTWQILVHLRKGPKLLWSATHNMSLFPDGDGKKKLVFTAYNVGDRPTTLTHLHLECRSTWLNRLRRRCDKGYLATNPLPQPLPHLLKPGERWIGYLNESPEIIEDIKNGILWAVVSFDGVREDKFRIKYKSPDHGEKEENLSSQRPE